MEIEIEIGTIRGWLVRGKNHLSPSLLLYPVSFIDIKSRLGILMLINHGRTESDRTQEDKLEHLPLPPSFCGVQHQRNQSTIHLLTSDWLRGHGLIDGERSVCEHELGSILGILRSDGPEDLALV